MEAGSLDPRDGRMHTRTRSPEAEPGRRKQLENPMPTDIAYEDPDSGKTVSREVPDPPPSLLEFLRKQDWSDAQIAALIDRLSLSADAKANLVMFTKATLKIGKTIVKIGRKIIDMVFSLLRHFPAMGFAVIFALFLGALISAIPLIGAVIGPLAMTIAGIAGVAIGGRAELMSGDFGTRVQAFLQELRPLAA